MEQETKESTANFLSLGDRTESGETNTATIHSTKCQRGEKSSADSFEY
jgi:hypothetical protein